MGNRIASPEEISRALAPLAEPAAAAAFFDLDGTLAPIVARPEDAAVPARTRELLGRIGERYALSGVLTGRRSLEARRIVGLESLTYAGNHGFEVLRAGAEEPEAAPALAGKQELAGAFMARADRARLEGAGLRVEDKAAIRALHWRGVADEGRAEAVARELAAEAEAVGLSTHWGRKVLEIRPDVALDKGVVLRSLLTEAAIGRGFYAGDDRTDADAFEALGAMLAAGALEAVVRVAVVSPESPPEVARGADLSVSGPDGFVAVLEELAR